MSPRRAAERSDDVGSGTVLVVALVAVVLVLAGALGLLAGAQSARGRAQAVADLAALAAAASVAVPPGVVLSDQAAVAADPCGRAAALTDRSSAHLARCEAGPGGVVEVSVEVRSPVGTANAEARAGPASRR